MIQHGAVVMQCVWNQIQEGREACSCQKLNNVRWWFISGRSSGREPVQRRWKLLHSSSPCFLVTVVGSSEHTKSSVFLAGTGDGISVRWWRHGCLVSVLELTSRKPMAFSTIFDEMNEETLPMEGLVIDSHPK